MKLTAVVPATNSPATLGRCLAAIEAADDAPEEVIAIEEPPEAGPAWARNEGAARATGDVLVFVDADVEVHADAITRIRRAFAADQELSALFGSYDDAPEAPGAVSGFRNLLHHHVHQSAAGPATTFWAGLSAIRLADFLAVGGFDHARYRRPSIEDIELGGRLTAAGLRVELDPEVQGKHLKQWTLARMVETDLLWRGAPWVALLLRTRAHSTALNLGWRHRASAAASVAAVAGVTLRRPAVAAAGLGALVALNAAFYRLLLRRRGAAEAVAAIPLHVVHHLTSAAAVPVGFAEYVRERRSG